MEIAWTLAPAVILVFVAVPTVRTIFATAGDAPPDALKVEVIGHQWWWEFKYPELGITTANELHVPVAKAVQVAITSADVIHSFWAPPLGGKRDAIPGQVNRIAFRADSVGDYSGQCAEFCGASHANMRLRVLVDSDAGFTAWVRDQQSPPATPAKASLAEQGKAIYARAACIGCHAIQGVSPGTIGPNLTHVATRTTIAGGLFHDARHHDGVPRTDAALGELLQLHRAAPDRGARRRVPAPQRVQLLGVPAGGPVLERELVRGAAVSRGRPERRARRRLVRLREFDRTAALPRAEHRLLAPGSADPGH